MPRPFRLEPQKLPRLREDDVEKGCLTLLALRGYWVGRNHCGLFRTADMKRWIQGHPKGTPDYACMHERFPGFLLEVKRPDGETSPDQDKRIREIRLGFRIPVAVIDSVDALDAWLRQHEAPKRIGGPL